VEVKTIGNEQGQHTTFAQSPCVLHQTHEQTAHLEAQSGMYHPERLHIYGGRQTLQTCKQVKSLLAFSPLHHLLDYQAAMRQRDHRDRD